MTTLVFGHKSPDTDATLSAIIWAWYLTHVRGGDARAVLLGEPNTEAAFLLNHWGFAKPEIIADVSASDNVVIVDTNNPAELPPSINDANIMAIIDHHMLVGGLRSKTPINVVMRPLACTATVMHDIMGDDLAKCPADIKGAMLSCILSDTLAFRSPTTTPHDRAVAEKLAGELGIDIPDFAAKMFEAKSDVGAFSDADLLSVRAGNHRAKSSAGPQGQPDGRDAGRGCGGWRRSGAFVHRGYPERRGDFAGAE
jgi:manganese-dependent inorganic pyrophosphatase